MSYERNARFESRLTNEVFNIEYDFSFDYEEYSVALQSWTAYNPDTNEEVKIVDKALSEEIESFCEAQLEKENLSDLEVDYVSSRADYYYDMYKDGTFDD